MNQRPYIIGALATLTLLVVFAGLVTAISGWATVQSQWSQYWYYLALLATGFGTQVGLFVHLRRVHRQSMPKGMLAATGGTSTAAMVSCCTHYLATLIPIIGLSGLSAFVGRYQVELFWVGLAFNAAGLTVLVRQVRRMKSVTHQYSHQPRPFVNNAVVIVMFALIVTITWFLTV